MAVIGILAAAAALQAQVTISGEITNGTTRKPMAHLALQLISPRGGMQTAAETRTNSVGRYRFSGSSIQKSGFYLVQAVYQGVDYHGPVQFAGKGAATVNITVYEATHQAQALSVDRARVLAQAEGDKIHVEEMFAVSNSSEPPRSYVNPAGTFAFHVTGATATPGAAAMGLLNMTLPQQVTAGKNPGDYSIDYALRPGLNVLMVAYQADYSSGQFTLGDHIDLPIGHLGLYVLPSGLSVQSNVFQANGQDDQSGAAKYVADNLAAGAPFAANLSGEAPSAASGESEVKLVPNSVIKYKAPLLAALLLILLWALGIRVSKEWPAWQAQNEGSSIHKEYRAKLDSLLNSMADLDEFFAAGKIPEKRYWKERLEMKAKIVALLKKGPKPKKVETYAARGVSR